MRLRLVVDTNLYVSASILSDSFTAKVVRWCLNNADLCFSQSTWHELETRIRRRKFDRPRYQTLERRIAFVASIRARDNVLFCEPRETISAIATDPADNRFLEVAVECQAACIVTGNRRHFKPLHPFRGIDLLEPREFWQQVVAARPYAAR